MEKEKIHPIAYIYYLQDPTMMSKKCYVGQTIQSPEERLRGHIKDVKRKRGTNHYNSNWISKLLARGIKPEILILEELKNVSQLEIDVAETWYIKSFRNMNIVLTNGTEDGGHTAHPTKEVVEKISKTLKEKYSSGEIINSFKNKTHTEENRQKQRDRRLGKKASEETKKKMSEQRQGINHHFYGHNHAESSKKLMSLGHQGSKNIRAKLTEQNVLQIKTLLFENKLMVKDIANVFNIDKTIISKMIAGERWKHCFTNDELIHLQQLQKVNRQKRMMSENNPMYGTHLSDEQKLNISGKLKGKASGIKNPMAKLTEEVVMDIKLELQKDELTQKQVANKFNTSQTTIAEINTGKRWFHIKIKQAI